jgi:hypothetical protein
MPNTIQSPLQQRVAEFTAWRNGIVASIDEFRGWLDRHGPADIEQTLRMYDMVEQMRNDRIRVAFLGESAAAKVALINALVFFDQPGGLLPGGVQADFMCTTEIFHDPNEKPYVRALPIDTRSRTDSLAALRRNPIDWVMMRVDPDSTDSMREALITLTESRTISREDAVKLNLVAEGEGPAELTVPAWRYALVNLPLPMLQSGLSVFYSPTLKQLSAEPEIALRLGANALSLLLVLGGELTTTARSVWDQYVRSSQAHKFAVVDPTVTAIHSPARIAEWLALAEGNVVPIAIDSEVASRLAGATGGSAGLESLERLHAEQIIPERRAALLSALARELTPMVQSAKQTVAAQFIATIREMQDLSATTGKNRNVALAMLGRLEEERKNYRKAVDTFESTVKKFRVEGEELLANLDEEKIEGILAHDRSFIEGAWTTAGLWKNMQGLFDYFADQVNKILNYAQKIHEMVGATYQSFHENFGLAKLDAPPFSIERQRKAMAALHDNAQRFCHDPVNVATYKDFLVKKFYEGLVAEARQIFELTRLDTERWLKGALGPLVEQIKDRELMLMKRVESLRNLRDNITSVEDRLKQLDTQRLALKQQSDLLDKVRSRLAQGPGIPASATAATSIQSVTTSIT